MTVISGLRGWWASPVPMRRIAAVRALVYLFIPIDVLVNSSWVEGHAYLPADRYQPLLVGRLLHLPTPGRWFVHSIEVLLLVAAVVAASGILPRLLGTAVFVLYFEWMVIAMSYGKVDHDRFAFLVMLAVLPTVTRARWSDTRLSESAGWALRCVQVAVIATYFLSSCAKIRYGGWGWVNGSVLMVAVLRRGTTLGRHLIAHPQVLHLAQWGIVGFELASPLVLFLRSDKLRYVAVAFFLMFHLVTYETVGIIFLPHIVCLAAFLPMERAVDRWLPDRRRRTRPVSTFEGAHALTG